MTDTETTGKIRYEELAKKLKRRGFIPHITDTKEELKRQIIELAGDGSVGFGGSSGIDSLQIYEALQEKGNPVYWHWKSSDKKAARDRAFEADTYLCSANALTLDGELVQIDGTGNRIGALIYGPERVIVVAAENKLAKDVESGLAQIRKTICPSNARRQGYQTPCAVTGECRSCISKDSMCRVTAVFSQPTRNTKEFHVFLLKEPLGL